MFIAMINIIIVKFYYLQIQEYEILRDRSLFSGGGGWATIFGGRVIVFFKPSRGGSKFFSSLQGEGHIFFLMVEHYLEQPTI